MAVIQGQVTVNEVVLLEVDSDPSAGAGTPAPLGSLAIVETGSLFQKTGPLDTDWTGFESANGVSYGSPVSLSPDSGNIGGTATTVARSDHQHDLPAAAPITNLSATTTNAEGTGTSVARNDHTHAILTGVVSTQTPDQTNAIGTSANLARADHIHNIPTGVPSTIGTANAQGTAAAFARQDHIHAHGDQPGGTLHSLATTSVPGFMSQTDKTKLDALNTKAGRVSGATFAGNPKKATVTFTTAFPSTNYSVTITGADARTWTIESKLAGSFVISANANTALTGEVGWQAQLDGEVS